VITWDLTFAFSGSADTGPHDKLSLGGLGSARATGRRPRRVRPQWTAPLVPATRTVYGA
jgi:spore coat protein CotH